jgi:cephalosporin-C deacetylase-like acetyl esterase
MRVRAETTSDGVTQRLFAVGDVPGAVWAPEGAVGPRPLVLLGHGGGGHAAAPPIAARAGQYVTGCGFAVAAIDAPGWGGRPVPAQYEPFNAEIDELTAAGKPLGDVFARRAVVAAALAIPEWRAAIDALTSLDWIGAGQPVGYWGLSLGCAIGLPLVAVEPRIRAAVLGLMGHETLAQAAAQLTVPVEFVLQWDDEIVPRASGLALFDAIGSASKSLHANPGGHADVPGFETDSSERFFARHLLA